MNVSEDLNDLGHDDNFFYNFFENEWDLDDDFFPEMYLIRSLLNLLNNLNNFFNMVNVFNNLFHLFHDCNPLNNSLNFEHLVSDVCYRDNFFFLYFDLSDLLNYPGDLHYFLDQFLYVLIYLDDLGNNSFDLDDLWNFD